MCSKLSMKLFIKFEDTVQSECSKHVSFWCLFFDPHMNTHQSDISSPIEQSSYQITHPYLNYLVFDSFTSNLQPQMTESPCSRFPAHQKTSRSLGLNKEDIDAAKALDHDYRI